jgi:hypothetical protein
MIYNVTYAFFAKVSKGSKFTVGSQLVALTSRYDITEIPITFNFDIPTQYISPTQEFTTIFPLTKNKNFYLIIYDWKILGIEPIKNPSFRTRLVDHQSVFEGSKKVTFYFIPTNYSIAMNLHEVPQPGHLSVTPS